MKSFLNISLFCISTILYGHNIQAQAGGGNARSQALAGAYSALARGAEVSAWNPAKLGLQSSPRFSLILFGAGFNVENSSLSVADYKNYNGKFLTADDKRIIMQKIPGSGFGLRLKAGAQALSFSVGRFAISAGMIAASNIRFSREFVDLAFYGNEPERIYDLSQTGGKGYGVADFSLSYGQPIQITFFQESAVGFTAHYFQGISSAEILSASGTLLTDRLGLHAKGEAVMRTALGGSGYAFDLGVAGSLSPGWTLSMALKNVVSRIGWNKDVKIFTWGAVADSIDAERLAGADDVDDLIINYDSEIAGEDFHYGLPTRLTIGAVHKNGSFDYAVELSKGFSNGPATSTKAELATGLEYTGIGFLPLRAGIAFGGTAGVVTGMGFGIKFRNVSLNFAAQAAKAALPGQGQGIGLAFDMKVGI